MTALRKREETGVVARNLSNSDSDSVAAVIFLTSGMGQTASSSRNKTSSKLNLRVGRRARVLVGLEHFIWAGVRFDLLQGAG